MKKRKKKNYIALIFTWKRPSILASNTAWRLSLIHSVVHRICLCKLQGGGAISWAQFRGRETEKGNEVFLVAHVLWFFFCWFPVVKQRDGGASYGGHQRDWVALVCFRGRSQCLWWGFPDGGPMQLPLKSTSISPTSGWLLWRNRMVKQVSTRGIRQKKINIGVSSSEKQHKHTR